MKLWPIRGVGAGAGGTRQTCESVYVCLWPLSQKQQQTGPDMNLRCLFLSEGRGSHGRGQAACLSR